MKVIIIGGGEIGFYLAERLTSENMDVVLIDNNFDRTQLAHQELDIQVIHGEGSSPLVLAKAGIQNAEMVIAVTTSDEVNMIACLIASDQSHVPVKVARIRNLEYIHNSNILGSDHLGIDCHINPEMEAAEKIVNLCKVPSAGAVVDLAEGKLRMFSVRLDRSNRLVGKKLKELAEFGPDNQVLICAIQRHGQTLIPTGDTMIEHDDVLWLITVPAAVHDILSHIGIKSAPVRRAMIFGGSITSRFVAERLVAEKITVKMIHTERKGAEELAQSLENVLVLHVPNIDRDILVQENIEDFSVFIATSNDDEDNILASILAKRLGVDKAVTLLDRMTYNSIINAIGVDNVVNRRYAAADRILQYIRKGKVQSTSSVGDTGAEAIEFEALQSSDAVGKPLHEIRFPKGSLVVGILKNGSAIIPRGRDVIEAGDRVVIITLPHAIPKVEKIFQVKVEYF